MDIGISAGIAPTHDTGDFAAPLKSTPLITTLGCAALNQCNTNESGTVMSDAGKHSKS